MSAPRRTLRVGISTCPNDTFAFHGLLTGAVLAPGLDLEFVLADVQELNEGVLSGRFDVAKVSFHLALLHARELWVLPSGSALGFGNGPLLLAAPGLDADARPGPDSVVLCPGEHTTASLLFRMFHPGAAAPQQVLFSDIMPALERRAAHFGVCIHEGRFTFAERGLVCLEDFGARWEQATGAPLPLGGIVVRRSLGEDVARRMQAGLRASLEFATHHPEATLPTMRAHAAELADDVLWQHVDLYVNAWTMNLGAKGRRALEALSDHAHAVLQLRVHDPVAPLEVLASPGRLFHVIERSAHDRHDWREPWTPPSLAAEGFVHLSCDDQVRDTLAVHYRDAHEVVLLELDPLRVNDAVVFEASRGGALFPHLYRALESTDVLRSTLMTLGPDR